MVSNGNHPLNKEHIDEVTLQEYTLGQLLPDEEQKIRDHLADCSLCKTAAAEMLVFAQQISRELHRGLDEAEPSSPLSFDPIESEWRKPRSRRLLAYRLSQLLHPDYPTTLLLILLALAFALLVPSSGETTLNRLELISDYHGPNAVVAAATDDGIVVLRLENGTSAVALHLAHLNDPRNLQFSPNGRWLALQQGRTLHIIEVRQPGGYARIPVSDMADWSWSPDSRQLAYTDGTGQLALFDVTAQTNHVLVPASDFAWGAPVWTADGSQIAYTVVNPLPTDGQRQISQGIWRVTPDSGFRVELARNPTPEETLLAPAAWSDGNTALLAWDVNASARGTHPTLYRVDTVAHHIDSIDISTLAQDTRMAWPVSSLGITFAVSADQMVAYHLGDNSSEIIPKQIPMPHALDWAPNGAWMAYTVSGAPEGEGLYLFAPSDGTLRQIYFPGGATEKAVYWAGAEHLFVIRQPRDSQIIQLWLVSLTSNEAPQRIITNVRLPETGHYTGWRWQDVLTMQVPAD